MTNATVVPAWITCPGETSLWTIVPAIGDRIGSSGRIGTFCCSASCTSFGATPKMLQGLQRRLHVGLRIVVVGLHRLVITLGNRLVLEQVLVPIEVVAREVETVLGFSVARDCSGDVGTGHVEERLVRGDLRARVDQNPRDRAAHLRDGLGGVVVVPVDCAGVLERRSAKVRLRTGATWRCGS